MPRGCFPESHPSAVLLPERFRGGCAFGSGLAADLSRRDHLSNVASLDLPEGAGNAAPE
jgi:hypothetical protein